MHAVVGVCTVAAASHAFAWEGVRRREKVSNAGDAVSGRGLRRVHARVRRVLALHVR